jgi:hypothetical protein
MEISDIDFMQNGTNSKLHKIFLITLLLPKSELCLLDITQED